MKVFRPFAILVLMVPMLCCKSLAQNGQPNNNTNTVQPTIMVIPFTRDDQDIRTVLESDFDKRQAIARVKNGFDQRGFTTVDFTAKLNQAKDEKLFVDGQADVKSTFVQNSGADMYVEVDIHFNDNGKAATILLSAYDSATAAAYSSVACGSGEHYNSDKETLINAALLNPCPGNNRNDESLARTPQKASCLDEFLTILDTKFADIVKKGKPVKVDFALSQTASKNFDSKVTVNGSSVQLKDAIDDWLSGYAVNGNVHMGGQTKVGLFYDQVRIPLFDKNGNNLSLSKTGQKIAQFLQSIGISASRDIRNGGIYITVTN